MLQVHMDKDELAKVHEFAKQHSLDTSKFVRLVIRKAMKQEKVTGELNPTNIDLLDG